MKTLHSRVVGWRLGLAMVSLILAGFVVVGGRQEAPGTYEIDPWDVDELLDYTMTSAKDLSDWFTEQQERMLPFAPPDNSDLVLAGVPETLPITGDGAAESFGDVVAKWQDGVAQRRLLISEDPITRERLFWDEDAKLVGKVAAPKGWTEFWGARKLPKRYDPSRIIVSTTLVDEDAAPAYVAVRALGARSSARSGIGMMMLGGGDDQLVVDRIAPTSGTLAVSVKHPSAYTGTVWEVYSFDEGESAFAGRASAWVVAETNLVLTGTTYSTWIDSGQGGRAGIYSLTNRYYVLGHAGVDSDADDLSDGREAFVIKTDPYDADSDNDGLSDGDELRVYGTSPLNPDMDDDGMPDGWEVQYGLNPTSPVPRQGEGWWKFDETTDTNAANSAGNGYAGGLVNMATNAWVAGQLGNALQFDGTNDYVRVPQSPAIITGQHFTASAWVWLDSPISGIFPSIIADMGFCGGWYPGFWLGYDNLSQGAAALIGSCSSFGYPIISAHPTGRWWHVAGTYDGTTARLYVDGVLRSSDAQVFAPATQSEVRIGWTYDPLEPNYYLRGMLDDVRLYKTALTSNEVATMYENLADADGDGLNNMQEHANGTEPRVSDSDNDGLDDATEVHVVGTNPLDSDTDGDGLEDGWEVGNGLHPGNASGGDGAAGDPDSDGLNNSEEQTLGTGPCTSNSVLTERDVPLTLESQEGLIYASKDGWSEFVATNIPASEYAQKFTVMTVAGNRSISTDNGWHESERGCTFRFDPVSGVSSQTEAHETFEAFSAYDYGGCTETYFKSGLLLPNMHTMLVEWTRVTPCEAPYVEHGSYTTSTDPCSGNATQVVSNVRMETEWSVSYEDYHDDGRFDVVLSEEFTLGMLAALASDRLSALASDPAIAWGTVVWANGLWSPDETNGAVSKVAFRDTTTNQQSITLRKLKYRWGIETVSNVVYKLRWHEVFVPESTNVGGAIVERTENILGDGGVSYTQPLRIDPPSNDGTITPTTKIEDLLKVDAETVATSPADRSRTTIGIGEEVVCRLQPDIEGATWTLAQGGGSLEPSVGPSTRFEACNEPGPVTVQASVGGASCSVTFSVIAPSGMTYDPDHDDAGGFPHTSGPPDVIIGNGRKFNVTIQPTTVSFYNADLRENRPQNCRKWPDGSVDCTPPAQYPLNLGYDNRNATPDNVISGCRTIMRLYSPTQSWVSFSYSNSVPMEYKNQQAQWIVFMPDNRHEKLFTHDQSCALKVIGGNTQQSSYRGPWQGCN